jgi:mono/diheme cytochrome c family protein
MASDAPRIVVLVMLLAGSTVWAGRAGGQGAAPRTVWDGVYSQDQSRRGRMLSEASCVSCHGEQLTGTDTAPALQGDDFRAIWDGRSAGDLFEKIRTTMPADGAGTLTAPQSADLVAYILELNEFPAGTADLASATTELGDIRIRARK